jgi:hypothetical protein
LRMANFEAPPIIDAKIEKAMPLIQSSAVTVLENDDAMRERTRRPHRKRKNNEKLCLYKPVWVPDSTKDRRRLGYIRYLDGTPVPLSLIDNC